MAAAAAVPNRSYSDTLLSQAIGAYRTPGVKAVQRRQHRILQMSAAAALLLGTSAILVNKAFVKQPPSSVVPHTIHAWTGALALVGVAAQVRRIKTRIPELCTGWFNLNRIAAWIRCGWACVNTR